MPKTVRTTGEAAPNVAIDPVSPSAAELAETGRTSLLAIAHLHSRLMRNTLEVNAELLDFARRRVGEEISASVRLSRSRTSGEASEIMSEFYQRAFRDYAEEAEKVMKIGTDAALRSLEETQAEADETLHSGSGRVALSE